MEIYTKNTLEELRVDPVRLLPEERLDVIIQDPMGDFSKLREKEDSLE